MALPLLFSTIRAIRPDNNLSLTILPSIFLELLHRRFMKFHFFGLVEIKGMNVFLRLGLGRKFFKQLRIWVFLLDEYHFFLGHLFLHKLLNILLVAEGKPLGV